MNLLIEISPSLISKIDLRLLNGATIMLVVRTSHKEDQPPPLTIASRINSQPDHQVVREISNDLLPNTLLRKGLVEAMKESIDRINGKEGLKIEFIYSDFPEMGKEQSINLYRMVLEIIQNTIKHAKADLLKIEISKPPIANCQLI